MLYILVSAMIPRELYETKCDVLDDVGCSAKAFWREAGFSGALTTL